jgi:hypothetical protein
MDADITKPMRFKTTKRECWASPMPVQKGWVALTYWTSGRTLDSGIHELSEIENIPAVVRHTKYVRIREDHNALDVWADTIPAGVEEATVAKLVVWRDEQGKTHVEVAGHGN